MAQTIDGVTAPAGGFQQGGWYSGRQYWNGTLSAPGVINSQSDQQGAGQAVSNEVNNQSAQQQGVSQPQFSAYLANTPAPQMTNTQQVQAYTNGVQNGFVQNYQDPNSPGVQKLTDIATGLKSLLPAQAPTAPNLMDTYNKLTGDGTLKDLESNLIKLKADKADALAQFDVNKTAERSKPVAMNIMEGRISRQAKTAQENIDFIDRQISTVADELNMRYKSIETVMKYTQLDFENAKSVYDTQFTQAMSLITMARGIQQDQLTEQQRRQDNARANLQIYANAITSGNMSADSLSPDMVASLNAMELSSGLPMGFVQNLKMSPKDQIAHINDRTGEVYGFDGNGGLKVIGSVGASASGASSGTGVDSYTGKAWESKVASAIDILQEVDTSYQTVNGKLVPSPKNSTYDPTTGVTSTSKPVGDRYLSRQEAETARQQIINSVGGNQEVGRKLFSDAWTGGGYRQWGN